MNKNVNPVLALAVILVFGCLFFLKYHFYQMSLDVPRVSYIKESPSGDIFIRLGDQLYAYSDDGEFKRTFDLRKLGFSDGMKDFDFFSNGDILLNQDDYLPSFTDRLNRYLRKANTKTAPSGLGKGLKRCDLTNLVCRVLDHAIPAIQGTHFINIDRVNDDIYLADTGRHEIRKFDRSGRLLAEIKEGLKFPNQILYEANKLWIVDTNNHVMKAVKSETNVFGELIEQHQVKLDPPWIWPSSFSKVGQNWWVHVSENSMSKAKVAIYDNNWNRIKILIAEENTDYVVSQVLDKSVLISDSDNFLLNQYDFDGKRIDDFAKNESVTGIQHALKENKKRDQNFRFWSDVITWLGVTLFVLIFAYAIKQVIKDYRQKKAKERELDEMLADPEYREAALAALPINGMWIEARDKFKKLKRKTLITAVLTVLMCFYVYYLFEGSALTLLLIIGFSTLIIIILTIPMLRISKYKIGFFQNQVTLKTHTGKLLSETYENIKWGDRGFVIQEWYVPMYSKRNSIFEHHKFKEHLVPYLIESNKFSGIDALKIQWKSPEGAFKYSLIIIIFILSLAIYLD